MNTPEVIPAHIRDPEACVRRTRRLGGMLTRPFGVRLDAETSQRWMEVVSLFRITDNFLDDFSNGSLDERTEHILHAIHSSDQYTEWFPTLSTEHLGEELHEKVQTHGSRIVRLNHFLKTTNSPERYISLRRCEGRESARMLVTLTSDEMREQKHFDRFRVGMDMAGETINLLDSFLDISDDARRGEIRFQPTAGFRLKLLGKTARIATCYLPRLLREER